MSHEPATLEDFPEIKAIHDKVEALSNYTDDEIWNDLDALRRVLDKLDEVEKELREYTEKEHDYFHFQQEEAETYRKHEQEHVIASQQADLSVIVLRLCALVQKGIEHYRSQVQKVIRFRLEC